MFPDFPDNRSVYHYTSIGGVEGVLQGKLRFADISYMNDRDEVVCGLEEFRKNYLSDCSDEYRRLLERDIQQNKKLRTFVCCFSLDRDSLAMWNYYTKDINNKGFNIGFAYKDLIIGILKKNKELDGCKFIFGKVDYLNQQETYAKLAEKELINNLTAGFDAIIKACEVIMGKAPSRDL